jgi:hypothetical protein
MVDVRGVDAVSMFVALIKGNGRNSCSNYCIKKEIADEHHIVFGLVSHLISL